MKIKQSLFVGILFLVVFLGVIFLSMAIGKWNPAGIGVEHSDQEHEGEESSLPELSGSTNLLEWCDINKIPTDCVASKLGLTIDQLNQLARDISHPMGKEPYELVKMFEECLKEAIKPNYQEKTGELSSSQSISELHGNMNFKEWLISNGIPLDCASKKLGIPELEFDAEARSILEPKGYEPPTMTEVLKDCFGNQVQNQVKVEEKTKAETVTQTNHEEKIKATEPLQEEKTMTNQQGSTTLTGLPFLKGSDNVLEYLKTNKINIECVTRTLGLSESDLDKPAKDVTTLVGVEHVEYIREVIAKCN